MSEDVPDLGSPPRSSIRRGEGAAMARATFRDPVDFEEETRALQRDIARVLVNAPTLPVDLPAFDLTLLSVAAARNHIELVLGKSEPIAKLELTGTGDSATGHAVNVQIVDLHTTAARYQPQLAVMRERLRAAISTEKWQRALEPASRLARLPVGVPLAFFRQLVPGAPGQGLVRTGFNCNQDCGMCWQDRTWGRFDAEQILTWIEDLRAAGAHQLIISGGEPTLDANLADYLRRARQVGMDGVTLETNAIRFARGGLAERLRDAGLGDCFVSLHSGDAATSDAITRAPGTFSRTVAGIKALLAAGIPVRLNCVMTREGIDRLEGVPDFVHAEFGGHQSLRGLMLSQPTDPFDPALLHSIIPEPDRLRSILPALIDRAFALGIAVSGLDGPCGPPLCAFGADRRITALAPVAEQLAGRMYLTACAECAVRDACYGVRAADVELYGSACVQPLSALPPPA
jgi:hypothetical protein